MLVESLLVLAVLAVILVFFYKQAVKEFRILQTDSLDKAQSLLHERCPVVVLPAPTPKALWTRADIQQRPTLHNTIVTAGKSLKRLLTFESVQLNPEDGETLAAVSGFKIWAAQHLLPAFQTAWWGPFLTTRTEVCIGSQGLRQTYAYPTILLATEHAVQVSLLNEASDPYLPHNWQGKRLSKLTRDDAPFLPQIQYVDVIVRPGSALLIPPHWKVCWENQDPKKIALTAWVEVHHPVSHFLYKIAHRHRAVREQPPALKAQKKGRRVPSTGG